MMSELPTARRKLAEPVAEALLEDIRSGRPKPGDLLPSERALMAAHEIGRPAVREALQRLQHAGLVEIRHGGGPACSPPRSAGQWANWAKRCAISSSIPLRA